ncbi:hypothetical protein PAXRUDRAFT_70375, partial [Paxillus rubicundulus Ve08.2h10]
VEMELLGQCAPSAETPQDVVTWFAQGIAIKEAAIHLMKDKRSLKSTTTKIQKLAFTRRMDQITFEISKFINAATTYMESTIED